MSKESAKHNERLLASLQQQLAELEIRKATKQGIGTNIQSEIIDIRQQIEELKDRIFSQDYPRLKNYRYYIKIIPNILYSLLLIVAILWSSIFLLHFSNNIYLKIFCVFSATTVLYIQGYFIFRKDGKW